LRYAASVVFAAWLILSCWNAASKIGVVAKQLSVPRGMDNERAREAVYGGFYKFMEACNSQVPQNSTVFLATNNLGLYYYSSYYLYPRRVLINSPDKFVDGLAKNAPVELTKEFLKNNDISYILLPEEGKIIKAEW